jgi:hypothetical protein
MNINDLDDDEFAHLAQWIAATSRQATIDLRTAPAWRFAQARVAVDIGDVKEFPDISDDRTWPIED